MITNLTKINNNWIYQSNKLIEASHSFSVLEQKLIRLLASMIKKDDVDFKEYQFLAIDLSKILGIKQNNIYRDIDKITDKLMARVIKVKNDENEMFKKRHLVKIADFENGILTMKIDEEMKEFYLELKQYTKYQLKNVMQFKSTYSFRLYELLKQYEKIGSRIITIDDLRIALDIKTNQYPKYANLKQKVINVALNEININTDLHIVSKEFKEVRKVISIKFNITTSSKAKNEIASTSTEVEIEQEPSSDNIKQVQSIIHDDISDIEASKIFKAANGDIAKIKEKYTIISQLSKVKNVVGAMIRALKEDWKTTSKTKVSIFNDYEQRSYDFDELEKKLLGW